MLADRAGLRGRRRHPPRRARRWRSWRRRRALLSRSGGAPQTRAATARCFASPSGTRPAAVSGRSRARAATAPVSPASSSAAARVLEVGRTPRAERRLHGKDDTLDAVRTARAALASETLALPRTGERREALRLLLVARRSAVDVRREALTQLRGVIVTAPEPLRERAARAAASAKLLDRCSRLRRSAAGTPTSSRPGSCCAASPAASKPRPPKRTSSSANPRPRARARTQLLDEPGVGPIVAAQLLVAWSHRGRLRSEAAFARLAGVAPIPASSGQTTRHRLSRGGDRQLNRALHTIVLHRRQHDPATRDYIARRVAEGKTRRDATRLLKRYLARHLYRLLNQEPLMT